MMTTHRIVRASVLLLGVVILISGCNKDNDQELKDQEMRLLQQYLVDNDVTEEPTSSGLYYIPIVEGFGTRPDDYFLVDFEYTAVLTDGTLIYTSNMELAKENEIFSDGILYGPIRLLTGYTGIPGLDEGLKLMREGGQAELIMPSSINGFGATASARAPAYSTHIYTVELINAFDDPEEFETSQIFYYLNDHELVPDTITETGINYIEKVAGDGELIKDGDAVNLWYTGTFIDGRVFDSNVGGQIMTTGMPAINYIKAWDKALKLMRPGTQAKIIVPYEMAYGINGNGSIPPYMTLVFDIEIQSVSR